MDAKETTQKPIAPENQADHLEPPITIAPDQLESIAGGTVSSLRVGGFPGPVIGLVFA